MKLKVLLGVPGSGAAKLTGKLAAKLLAAGHEVQIVATKSSFYFWNEADLTPEIKKRVKVWRDEDEWLGERYVQDAPIAHIELSKWADVLLIAPLSKNTLFKVAYGGADNLLTCVAAAWWPLDDEEMGKPMVIAPAMNTRMWLHPSTTEQLQRLKNIQDHLTVVEPVARQLACGDYGVGALADLDEIVKTLDEVYYEA